MAQFAHFTGTSQEGGSGLSFRGPGWLKHAATRKPLPHTGS